MELRFFADPAAFLAVAGRHLAADPVRGTVVATTAERTACRGPGPYELPYEPWFLVVVDNGEVCGAAMRTAPFAPYPPYVLDMPESAAERLGVELAHRGEEVGALNGALPAARVAADAYAAATGRSVEVAVHTRLFELGALLPPAPVAGRLRAAGAEDLDVVRAWFGAFQANAAAQAGRPLHADPVLVDADLLRRIEADQVWLWTDESGEVVHLTAHSTPAFGAVRIGPVYTPAAERGKGYASAAVASVSARLSAAGDRVVLFTDQANPVSNRLYATLGFRQVEDHVQLLLVAG